MYDAIIIGARCAGSPTAMLHTAHFPGTLAGTVSIPEFFAPENQTRITGSLA